MTTTVVDTLTKMRELYKDPEYHPTHLDWSHCLCGTAFRASTGETDFRTVYDGTGADPEKEYPGVYIEALKAILEAFDLPTDGGDHDIVRRASNLHHQELGKALGADGFCSPSYMQRPVSLGIVEKVLAHA